MQYSLKPVEEQDIQAIDCAESLTLICEKLYILTGYKVELEQLGDFIAKQYMRETSINITTSITNSILVTDVFNIGCDSFRDTPKHTQFYREVEYEVESLLSRIGDLLDNGIYYGFSEGKLLIVNRKLNIEEYLNLPEEFIVTDGDGVCQDIRELRRYIKDENLLYTAIGQITKTLYRHPLKYHLQYRDTLTKEFSYEEVFTHSKYHPSEEDYVEILSILNSIYNTLILTINSYRLALPDTPTVKGIKLPTDIPYHISAITSSSIVLEKLNIWDCE